MTYKWFLKGSIICSILQLIGKCGETFAETKQYGEVKFVEESNYLTNDEKAHKKVNDYIKDVIRQENSRGLYSHPDQEGIRRFFYKKYMKIGEPKNKSFNNDNNKKDLYPLGQHNTFNNNILNNSNGYPKNVQQNQLSPTIASGVSKVSNFPVVKSQEYYSQQKIQQISSTMKVFNADQILHSNEVKPVKETFLIYNSSYYRNFGNIPENIPKQNNIENSFYYKRIMGLDNILDERRNNLIYIKKLDNNLLEKGTAIPQKESSCEFLNHLEDTNEEINKKKNTNKKLNYENNMPNNKTNIPINSNLIVTPSEAVKLSLTKDLLFIKKRSKNNRDDKINKDEKEFLKNIHQPPIEQRRVRSCELKMEDLRESFLPYEQLSIYHPRRTMTDQFILSDTIF